MTVRKIVMTIRNRIMTTRIIDMTMRNIVTTMRNIVMTLTNTVKRLRNIVMTVRKVVNNNDLGRWRQALILPGVPTRLDVVDVTVMALKQEVTVNTRKFEDQTISLWFFIKPKLSPKPDCRRARPGKLSPRWSAG